MRGSASRATKCNGGRLAWNKTVQVFLCARGRSFRHFKWQNPKLGVSMRAGDRARSTVIR